MSEKCVGPGKVEGKQCGRKTKRAGYCGTHYAQWLKRERSHEALEPLRGKGGRLYRKTTALALYVDTAVAKSLGALGAEVPEHPTDKRRTSLPLRGLRHLANAYAEGCVQLTGKYQTQSETKEAP